MGRLGKLWPEEDELIHLVREAQRGGAGALDALLARLSPEERAELAARAPELAAGGNPAAPVLAVAIIVGLLLILVLELIGRRVVSRPSTP